MTQRASPEPTLRERATALALMLSWGGDWAGPVSEKVRQAWRRELRVLRRRLKGERTPRHR